MNILTSYKPAAFAALAFALAGCVGGGGSGDGIAVDAAGLDTVISGPTIDLAKRKTLDTEYAALEKAYFMAPGLRLDHRQTGTATFNGVAALPGRVIDKDFYDFVSAPPGLVADIAMTVDFATHDVTGAMWDFTNKSGEVAGGSVQLTGLQSYGSVKASGAGTLDWADHKQALDISFDGSMVAYDIIPGAVGSEMYMPGAVRGNVTGTSTIGTETTAIEGKAILENDTMANPRVYKN